MTQVLQLATSIATPLALLGLVAALFFYAYSRRLKHDEKSLESLPIDERAAAVDRYLSRYKVEAGDLSKSARERLIKEEMDKNFRLARFYATISAAVFVICFVAAVVAYVVGIQPGPAPHPPIDPLATSTKGALSNSGIPKSSSDNIKVEPQAAYIGPGETFKYYRLWVTTKPETGTEKILTVVWEHHELGNTAQIPKKDAPNFETYYEGREVLKGNILVKVKFKDGSHQDIPFDMRSKIFE